MVVVQTYRTLPWTPKHHLFHHDYQLRQAQPLVKHQTRPIYQTRLVSTSNAYNETS
jgi:hypothetical protein